MQQTSRNAPQEQAETETEKDRSLTNMVNEGEVVIARGDPAVVAVVAALVLVVTVVIITKVR
jgi:CHASE3 domain sensor protein